MSTAKLAHALRFLSIDAVENAKSGHPGMPLGMADIATVLWQKFLKHNPKNPLWFNRDRFVLSNGHGSMLLYALLHMTGYDLSIDDIRRFRQLHSKTPGHPEVLDTPGVETTTGPLGQGLANAVGMAIAEKMLACEFNRQDCELVSHYTYTFVGDGCLMEGISHEVCSLAGTLGLGKLIVFYDDNGISIDGKVDGWFTDDTAARFRAYNWHVVEGVDGHDSESIAKAILEAQSDARPSLLICKTIIGYKSLKAGSEKTHGAPLGSDDIQQIRDTLSWPYAPFEIPADIYQAWDNKAAGQVLEDEWLALCHKYQEVDSHKYHQFLRQINGDLPDNFDQIAQQFIEKCLTYKKPIATRKASQLCIEEFAVNLPELIGGSADLTGSNNTNWSQTKDITHQDFSGNYINYGVREFGMAAIMNGLALHGGFIPYGGTFLVFVDYARNAVRLSALMKQRVIYVFTHDSIGLGEDGPTHQPIEHASMLRMTPNMKVWRPADLVETAVAWSQVIANRHGPAALLLSRQSLPQLKHSSTNDVKRGAYILFETGDNIDTILIATGSEVHIALEVAQELQNVRVVSMPCAEVFLEQDVEYQEQILPAHIRKRVAIEAGASAYWYRFVGLDGKVIGIDKFGVSAPLEDVYKWAEITIEHVIKTVKELNI